MNVYRIAKTDYRKDLSGNGASIYGGRWNQKGTKIVYTSENRSLATVEYLVHLPLSLIPTNLSLVTLDLPDEIIPEEINVSKLPINWRAYPAPSELADIGTNWTSKNESLLLRVPSAVVEYEYNVLLNPMHPDMNRVSILEIKRLIIDNRLIR